MNWLLGPSGGGGKAPSPLIAASGKHLATCIGVYSAIFWVPDIWNAWEDTIVQAILARYEGTAAALIYWLLKIAAYPLMFFAVKMGLGITFLSFVMGVMMNLFGGKR